MSNRPNREFEDIFPFPFPMPCGTSSCVNAEVVDDGVLVTSTIPGNDGAVTFTRDEWDAFGEQVKAGKWDHTFRV